MLEYNKNLRCEKRVESFRKQRFDCMNKEFWDSKLSKIKQDLWKIKFNLLNNYRNFIFDLQTRIINLVDPSYYRTCPTEESVKSSVFRFGRYMNPTKNKLFNRIIGL